MSHGQLGTIANRDHRGGGFKVFREKITRGRGHMSGRTYVEVPFGGARRLCGHADYGQRLVEWIPVAEGAAVRGLGGHHGLLRLEGWTRTQDANTG